MAFYTGALNLKNIRKANRISMGILYLAAGLFSLGTSLAVMFDPRYVGVMLGAAFLTALLSAPITLWVLWRAYRLRIIGPGYFLIGVMLSVLMGASVLILPFMLNRDINEAISFSEAAGSDNFMFTER